MLRSYPKWDVVKVDEQLEVARRDLAAAAGTKPGLRLWVGLYNAADGLGKRALLEQIVDGLKNEPGLGAWKGADEPLWGGLKAAALVAAYEVVRARDRKHPLVLIQAPKARPEKSTAAAATEPKARSRPLSSALLRPYAAAADIHGVDIYPVSHPAGAHADRPNKDISVVGDLTEIVVRAAPTADHWMTLQIAWSGVIPPEHVPICPSLRQERFMAYQAIISGARGLVFFGGHIGEVMSPRDARSGWNWTFWHTVLKPLVHELTSTAVGPCLVAPTVSLPVAADATDVRMSAREAAGFLYLLTCRRSPTAHGRVRFSGLPGGVKEGQVLFEYDHAGFRAVKVARGVFTDAFAPHDARVYRFALPV